MPQSKLQQGAGSPARLNPERPGTRNEVAATSLAEGCQRFIVSGAVWGGGSLKLEKNLRLEGWLWAAPYRRAAGGRGKDSGSRKLR